MIIRKVLSRLLVVCLALVCFVAAASTVNAQATVNMDFLCSVGAAGWSPGGFSLFTTDTMFVIAPSGKRTLSCRFDIPAGSEPSTAVRINVGCGSFGTGVTVSTPGGQVNAVCHN